MSVPSIVESSIKNARNSRFLLCVNVEAYITSRTLAAPVETRFYSNLPFWMVFCNRFVFWSLSGSILSTMEGQSTCFEISHGRKLYDIMIPYRLRRTLLSPCFRILFESRTNMLEENPELRHQLALAIFNLPIWLVSKHVLRIILIQTQLKIHNIQGRHINQ